MQQKVKQYVLADEGSKSLADMNADEVRGHVSQATRDFKDSWRNLAEALHVVWTQKLYRNWGYDTFDHYTAKEVRVRKHTAMKLIRSYMFLEREEPAWLQRGKDESSQDMTPTFEMVNELQRAKKNLDDRGYQKVKDDLMTGNKDVGDVKKDLTALITQRRKDVDPEKERTRKGDVSIKRFLSVLEEFEKEIKTLHILPGFIADDIRKLAGRIKECVADSN